MSSRAAKRVEMTPVEQTLASRKGAAIINPPHPSGIQNWPIDRLVFYARNPRKNDAAVDRMCGSIREFGFKIPVLARSDGEVVDGHLRLKAARKLDTVSYTHLRAHET